MKIYRLQAGNRTLIESVLVAKESKARMKGLLGCKSLPTGEGLFILRCGSIHTFFMRFRLDLLFLDRELRIVRIVKGVKPFRMAFGGWRAASVVEVESGWLDLRQISTGDQLALLDHAG